MINIQADWLRDTDESLDPRISAVIASVEDIKEVHEVALEYKKYLLILLLSSIVVVCLLAFLIHHSPLLSFLF